MWQYLQTEMLCKRKGKNFKTQELMFRDIANVEPDMYDCISNNWGHWNNNENVKEKFGSCTRKIFDSYTAKESFILNITHNMESIAM